MPFRFYIDGQLTDQPDNDMELLTTIRRDNILGGLVITQDVTLIYTKTNAALSAGVQISGFAYLNTLYEAGSCNLAKITIYDYSDTGIQYLIYSGTVGVPSMEISLQPVRLSCKVDDNSYYSYIKNNGNIPFSLYALKTKNGFPIVAPQIYEVNMFDSATGALLGTPGNYWKGYRLYDVLSFLISAISDNEVTFYSDYLLDNQFGIELFIFDGDALAHANQGPNITVSFNQIMKELRKLKNIEFYIDQSDPDNPVFRLENQAWFYIQSDILDFNDPLKVTTSIKTDRIYGTIRAGSEYNPGGAGYPYTWNSGTSYFGWKDEKYTPLGQCNDDNELDLLNEFIIASNAINDQVIGAVDSNLEETFLVECWLVDNTLFTAQATDYDTYAPAPERYYNIGLNNVNKIALHGASFQSSLTNTANSGTDICHIELGSEFILMDQTPGSGTQSQLFGPPTPVVTVPVPFADEFGGINYDPGGNWDNITNFIYTAPTPGNYSFQTTIRVDCLNFKDGYAFNTLLGGGTINILNQYSVIITVDIEAYTDATFTTLLDSQFFSGIYSNGTFDIPVSLTTILPIGAVVRVRVQCQFILLFPQYFGNSPVQSPYFNAGILYYTANEPKAQVVALANSSFVCNGTPVGGLILASSDPEAFKIKQMAFEYNLTATQWRTIMTTPLGRFRLIKHGVTYLGWVEEFKINNQNGHSLIKLIMNNASV